jgi:hypothetical protein
LKSHLESCDGNSTIAKSVIDNYIRCITIILKFNINAHSS